MTARLILICHGSTEAVRAAKFPADEPLDELGSTRAAALAAHLPSARQSWTSPELRTRQTAQALRLDAEVNLLLRDCDYGTWTGRTLDDVQAQEPEAVAVWLRDSSTAPHGGESIGALMRRVEEWLAAEHVRGGQSIIVTHASIIRAAIVHAIKAPPVSFWRIDIAPLSVTRLSGTDGRWNLTSAGCTQD